MAQEYRRLILNKLISDLSLLTHTNSSNKLFGSVKPYFVTIPTTTPACEVLPGEMTHEVEGFQSDIVRYNFTISIYESIGAKATDDDASAILQKLMKIEDRVSAYLLKVPNPMEHVITGIHIFRQGITNSDFGALVREGGVGVVLTINCYFDCNVNTYLL